MLELKAFSFLILACLISLTISRSSENHNKQEIAKGEDTSEEEEDIHRQWVKRVLRATEREKRASGENIPQLNENKLSQSENGLRSRGAEDEKANGKNKRDSGEDKIARRRKIGVRETQRDKRASGEDTAKAVEREDKRARRRKNQNTGRDKRDSDEDYTRARANERDKSDSGEDNTRARANEREDKRASGEDKSRVTESEDNREGHKNGLRATDIAERLSGASKTAENKKVPTTFINGEGSNGNNNGTGFNQTISAQDLDNDNSTISLNHTTINDNGTTQRRGDTTKFPTTNSQNENTFRVDGQDLTTNQPNETATNNSGTSKSRDENTQTENLTTNIMNDDNSNAPDNFGSYDLYDDNPNDNMSVNHIETATKGINETTTINIKGITTNGLNNTSSVNLNHNASDFDGLLTSQNFSTMGLADSNLENEVTTSWTITSNTHENVTNLMNNISDVTQDLLATEMDEATSANLNISNVNEIGTDFTNESGTPQGFVTRQMDEATSADNNNNVTNAFENITTFNNDSTNSQSFVTTEINEAITANKSVTNAFQSVTHFMNDSDIPQGFVTTEMDEATFANQNVTNDYESVTNAADESTSLQGLVTTEIDEDMFANQNVTTNDYESVINAADESTSLQGLETTEIAEAMFANQNVTNDYESVTNATDATDGSTSLQGLVTTEMDEGALSSQNITHAHRFVTNSMNESAFVTTEMEEDTSAGSNDTPLKDVSSANQEKSKFPQDNDTISFEDASQNQEVISTPTWMFQGNSTVHLTDMGKHTFYFSSHPTRKNENISTTSVNNDTGSFVNSDVGLTDTSGTTLKKNEVWVESNNESTYSFHQATSEMETINNSSGTPEDTTARIDDTAQTLNENHSFIPEVNSSHSTIEDVSEAYRTDPTNNGFPTNQSTLDDTTHVILNTNYESTLAPTVETLVNHSVDLSVSNSTTNNVDLNSIWTVLKRLLNKMANCSTTIKQLNQIYIVPAESDPTFRNSSDDTDQTDTSNLTGQTEILKSNGEIDNTIMQPEDKEPTSSPDGHGNVNDSSSILDELLNAKEDIRIAYECDECINQDANCKCKSKSEPNQDVKIRKLVQLKTKPFKFNPRMCTDPPCEVGSGQIHQQQPRKKMKAWSYIGGHECIEFDYSGEGESENVFLTEADCVGKCAGFKSLY